MRNIDKEIKKMEAIRDWHLRVLEIIDAKRAELDRDEAAGDVESARKPIRLPPCPVCGGEVTKSRRLRLDYGATFKPCGCQLGIESWQTRVTRRCASSGLFFLLLAGALGLFVGPAAATAVSISTVTAGMLIAVSIIALFLPRRAFE